MNREDPSKHSARQDGNRPTGEVGLAYSAEGTDDGGELPGTAYLHQITAALGLPSSYFDRQVMDGSLAPVSDHPDEDLAKLLAAFARLNDPVARRLLVEIVEGLAASPPSLK